MNDFFNNAPVAPYIWTSTLDYIEWANNEQIDIGVGGFEDMLVEIELTNVNICSYNGLELSFKVFSDKCDYVKDYSQDTTKSSMIVGFVTNAVVSRINNHYWDFLYCKDSWFFGMIMRRIHREQCLSYTGNNLIHVIGRKDVDISSIKSNIDNLL